MEMLPAFIMVLPSFLSYSSLQASLPSNTASSSPVLTGNQAHKSRDQRHGANLRFLPPIDRALFVLLQDANLYCSVKKYAVAVSSLCTALQLISKGHVLEDGQHLDPEDINLIMSYIPARPVVRYLRMKTQLGHEYAHRSVLTADWLYCLSGGTERHISTQLKLYWQGISQVKEAFMKQNLASTG